jgi:hypothetical protein
MRENVFTPMNKRLGIQNLVEENGGTLLIDGDIVVEVDNITFNIVSDGNSAVVYFHRIPHAFRLLDIIRAAFYGTGRERKFFEEVLDQVGVTLCVQSRLLGFMGPNSNWLLRRIFNYIIFR